MNVAAALDHQPADPAAPEIVQHRSEVQRLARARHLRELTEPVPDLAYGGIGGVQLGLCCYPSSCQVQPPLMSNAAAPARLTVSGPVKLLLSMMLLVSVLASVAS